MSNSRIDNIQFGLLAERITRHLGVSVRVQAVAYFQGGYFVETLDGTNTQRNFLVKRKANGVTGMGYTVSEMQSVVVLDAESGKVTKLAHLTDLIESPGTSKSLDYLLFALSWFVPPQIRDSVIGDAEERYRSDVKRFGIRRATWLLRWDVLRTAVLYVWAIAEGPILRLLVALRGVAGGR